MHDLSDTSFNQVIHPELRQHLAPFIPFTITLPGDAKPTVKALDGAGNAIGELPATEKKGQWSFSAQKTCPSLWFAIER